MDLHEFDGGDMYFDTPPSQEVLDLIDLASGDYMAPNTEYGNDSDDPAKSETALLKAYLLAPKDLTVIVALYRYYYFQHQYQMALLIADKALEIVAEKLMWDDTWEQIDTEALVKASKSSMTLVRFYLLCLKGSGYLNLRLGNIELGVGMLEKVSSCDQEDRIGTRYLLDTVANYRRKKKFEDVELKLVES